jgi:hypothetical protein
MPAVTSAVRMIAGLAAGLLGGCAGSADPVMQTLRAPFQRDPGVEDVNLNPDYRYLRVNIAGRTALLALGYVDDDPGGPVEVWYSAEREVLKLQQGRVVGAFGMTTEWRNVRLSEAPAWLTLAREGRPRRLQRVRDVMPGYRYGAREELALAAILPPERTALRDLDAKALAWFEERVEVPPLGDKALPPARYAVQLAGGAATVVYGEQCLAPETCFTWQRWPAK